MLFAGLLLGEIGSGRQLVLFATRRLLTHAGGRRRTVGPGGGA